MNDFDEIQKAWKAIQDSAVDSWFSRATRRAEKQMYEGRKIDDTPRWVRGSGKVDHYLTGVKTTFVWSNTSGNGRPYATAYHEPETLCESKVNPEKYWRSPSGRKCRICERRLEKASRAQSEQDAIL